MKTRNPDNQEFVIAENQTAKMTIVLEEDNSMTANFAAEELSRYLTMMTGAEFPVSRGPASGNNGLIILRKRKASGNPRNDGYAIQTRKGNLYLLGDNDRGLLYGVYAFLESLGARWFEPGTAGEDIPLHSTLTIPKLNISDKPAFDVRGFTVTACGPVCPQVGLTFGELTEGQLTDLIDWTAKQKQNYISFLSSRIEVEARGWMPMVARETRKRGLILALGGHSWVNAPYGLGENWHEDPENLAYIAMLDGERKMPAALTQEFTAHARTQLCASNEKGVEKVVANAMKYIEDNPHVDALAMFAADNKNHWCECAECLKLSPTDLYMTFIKRLAEELKKRHPEKILIPAAYLETTVPPDKVDLSGTPDNVVTLFCRHSCVEHPLNAKECSSGGPPVFDFPRNQVNIPQGHNNDWFNAALNGWRERSQGPICVLDYSHWMVMGTSRYGDLLFPDPNTLQADLRYYQDLGVTGHVSVIHPLFSWPNALDAFLLAKLNWNPDLNLEETTRDYVDSFHKESNGRINSIISELRERLDRGSATKEDIDVITDYWAELKTFRPRDVKAKERAKRLALYLEYLLIRKRFNHLRQFEDRRSDATACLRELFNFYCRNQHRLQPYFEIIDLVVKKNFEFN